MAELEGSRKRSRLLRLALGRREEETGHVYVPQRKSNSRSETCSSSSSRSCWFLNTEPDPEHEVRASQTVLECSSLDELLRCISTCIVSSASVNTG
ncbi:hypothetical protein EYF80_010575 [Liparis tanakae]|uniref:Uncharacterized protein n=1 Tax=Liparis tanakae TaxID=230148 RepID=A0A4Z2IMX8_9TELE|nr:hypothetical protein EYF80_010575 [Liparis tanakae]